MTIAEAIATVDSLKPNTFTQEQKIVWLSNLDKRITVQILGAHEKDKRIRPHFYGYDETDLDTELIAPAPYDTMYLRWLEAMIDYHNSDDDRYNNAIILCNNDYEDFKTHYTRTHMPLNKGRWVY